MRMVVDSIEINCIDSQTALAEAAATLEKAESVAVDSESNSLYVYYEKVCLLQLSTKTDHYLIDPFPLGKLEALASFFKSSKVQKIFHAAEYDILCLKRDYGFEFNNLFDTMIAARILGKKEIGLSQLLESELNIHVDKKYQKADWGIRPLPKAMIEYAIHDTCYLIQLKSVLEEQLRQRGLIPLANEDFIRLAKTSAGVNHAEMPNWWQIAGHRQKLNDNQAAILYRLCQWREEVARNRDFPPFKILGNDKMLDIALAEVATKADLAQLFQPKSYFLKRHADSMLKAIQKNGENRPIPQPQKHACPSPAYLWRWDRLKTWRKEYGAKIGVASDVILPKDIMEAIVAQNPKNLQSLERIMEDIPWRFHRFGEQILKLLQTAALHTKEETERRSEK